MKTRFADLFGVSPPTIVHLSFMNFCKYFQLFSEPVWQELLPPPLPPQYQKPLTLVISLDDLLVNSVWDVSRSYLYLY